MSYERVLFSLGLKLELLLVIHKLCLAFMDK